MSQKIKPRQMRKPRSMVAYDAIMNHKGGPHRNRQDKRRNNPNKQERWDDHHGV